jgi:hypothetical protein
MELAASLASVLRGDTQKVLGEIRRWMSALPAPPTLDLPADAAPRCVPSPLLSSSLPRVDDLVSLLEQCCQADAGPQSLWAGFLT